MNKQRLLKLLEILKRNTDIDHKLNIDELINLLSLEEISVSNRKTLYDDFKTISDSSYDIEYDKGYYLSEAPFSLSEIKIIIDSINSLKNLDDKFLNDLKDKLYSFISIYEEKDLKKLEYHIKHSDKRFINRLEDSLDSIRNNKMMIIKRTNKDEELIAPIFLYRLNDYYYLYYHYPNNDKIYHTRFDNIQAIKLSDIDNDINISINKIKEYLEQSSNAFYSKKAETITFKIINDSDYLRSRLMDDFSNIVFTKDGFSIKASINEAFYSKLVSYSTDIKISDKDIADKYISYLNNIIRSNQENRNKK